jgi:F-type H+-transporting ATPase subunit b
MRIDWWTLGLQTVNALVLILLLSRFLFRPIASILAERRAAAQKLLDEAEAAKLSARTWEERARSSADAIEETRAESIRTATAQARRSRDEMLDAAHADADRMRAEMRAEIARLEKSARRAEAERASLLAVDIARRLVERLPPAARVAGFIDGLADAVADLPEPARANFGLRGDAILTAPRPLTEEEASLCRSRLDDAFGHPVPFALRVDPTVLAGLELENDHTAVRNSLRADLQRISSSLLTEREDG